MAERLSPLEHNPQENELKKSAEQQNERLREDRERAADRSMETESNAEKARESVEKAIETKEREAKQETVEAHKVKAPKRTPRTKKTLDASFAMQMSDVRNDMPAPNRAFSKFIHSKPIEKTSEAVGSTVARPNAILAGSVTAFLLTALLYFWAKYVGYPLSGFETIGAFIIGWLIGMIIDFTRIMFTGKS